MVKTPEEQKEMNTLRALASDISEGLKQVKHSGSNEKRAALKAFTSLAFGENIKKTRARKSLGKIVDFNVKSISKAIRTRESILKGDTECWLYTKRKVRQDVISEEDGKAIFNYWTNTASRPTGDKKDIVKKRIGKQQYVHHANYLNVKVKQRKFESLKPFFVKQAKERDRRSCLCRKHVETKIVFNACMKFRQGIAKEADNNNEYPVLKTVTEAAEKTLCPEQEISYFTTSSAWKDNVIYAESMPCHCYKRRRLLRALCVGHTTSMFQLESFFQMAKRKRR